MPKETRESFGAFCAKHAASFITPIITTYQLRGDEHSGTGLVVTDDAGRKFCLTANHVVTPSSRSKPPNATVAKHSYVEDIAHVEFRTPMPPFKLRSRFYKSEKVDIAMLESSINGISGAEFFRQSYFPLSNLTDCRNGFDAMLDDVFVICGFPTAKITKIAANKVEHSLLVHFVTGRDGDRHSLSTRYTLHYSSKYPAPAGLSGSPVWLLRGANNLAAPLDVSNICKLIERGDPIAVNMSFSGMVVSHVPDEEVLQVVRPEICAQFTEEAYEILPDLRDAREDVRIAEEFEFWLERYASRFDNVRL